MNLSQFAVRRPVMVIVIFVVMVLFGLFSINRIPIDLMPEIELPAISVITIYAGAGAEEVEEKISKPIESAVSTVSDLEDITSRSVEGISVVTCQFEYGSDLSDLKNDIRDKINMVMPRLPEDVDQPMIFQMDMSMMPVLFVGIKSADREIKFLNEEVEQLISDPIQRIPGVGSVVIFGQMEKKIILSADKNRLAALNLTVEDLSNTVAAENLSMPAGHMEMGDLEYTIRVPGEYADIDEVKETIVASTPNGLIKVKDVARVFWGSQDNRQFALMDKESSIMMMIMKQSGSNTVEIASRIREKLKGMEKTLPKDIKAEVIMDTSEFIENMVSNLANAIFVACGFVLLVVVFFLRRIRSSFIVLLSIPASLIVAFAFLYGFDYSLNMVSLMALSLAIGMVVDNAIVVLDNITRHLEQGVDRKEAAVRGSKEVGGAIVASTMTTIMIFAPLFFVGGLIGIMFSQLAGVIILTLAASLLAAMMLTPMVCSKILTSKINTNKRQNLFYRIGEGFLSFVEKLYSKIIRWTLRRKKTTIFLAVALFVGSLFLIPIVGVDFMPEEDQGRIMVEFEMPLGTKVDNTLKTAQDIERIMIEEVPSYDRVRTFMKGGPSDSGFSSRIEDTNTATVMVMLRSLNNRRTPDKEYVRRIRNRVTTEVPGIERIDYKTTDGGMSGSNEKPVTLKILNSDILKRAAAAKKLEKELEKIPGLTDVSNDADSLKPEIEVKIDRVRASQLGVKVSMVGTAVRYAFYGKTASVFRKDGDEFDFLVTLKKEDRNNVEQLKELEIKTVTGNTVKLKDVAQVKEGLTSLVVNRLNRERIVTVSAALEDNTPIGKVATEVEKAIDACDFPSDIAIEYGGNLKNEADSTGDLVLMLLLGVVLVYLVMAAQFESFLDPFIILFSIPFSITGVILGLLITGNSLSVPAFLGMIILVGVVVNNAIVLLDYTNMKRKRDGMNVHDALVFSGQSRLRPILMTATTTISGMLPLALMQGEGHEAFQPMGVAVVFGLMVSTMVTLILMPSIYGLIHGFLERRAEKKAAAA